MSDKGNSEDRLRRFQRGIERINADVEGRCREELNQCAQQGAGDPPHNTSLRANQPSSTCGDGMSNAVSIVKREKHVATSIMQFVKSEVFRRIKFVNSAEMFQKAFVKVIEFEKVPPNNSLLFQLTYESCFNKALNTKRSSCEQAGRMLARKAIADFKKHGEERKGRSFGFLIHSWSVFAGRERGETPRKPCWYRRHEMSKVA